MVQNAYICLGSNMGDSLNILNTACKEIAILGKIISCSSVYKTEPQGFKNQNWFYNQAIKVAYYGLFDHSDFLYKLLEIEKKLGRRRNFVQKNGPRVIDIDLLLFGSIKSNNAECILPHPRMLERAFVLVPLMEIEPDLVINGYKLSFWLKKIQYRQEDLKIFQ